HPSAYGAGATLSSATATTGADGTASVTVMANAVVGNYSVTASVAGAWPVTFELANGDLVVTTADDVVNVTDGRTSLREAINFANALPTAADVTFGDGSASGGTDFLDGTPHQITLGGSELELKHAATTTISGPGQGLLSISGGGLSRVFGIDAG